MNNTNEIIEINNNKEYKLGIDIVKIIAMLFVILGHVILFFGGFNFKEYNSEFVNYLILILFHIFSCAVPLFILITGYLSFNKKPTKSYFSKLAIYLLEYVLCCVFVWIIKTVVTKETVGFWTGIKAILTFNMISYSWYINMFIGLYLLAPFINIMYHSIADKKTKQILLLILFIIVMIPSSILNLGWNYWISIYPLMFYILGLYIREYKPKFKKVWLILIIIVYNIFEVFILKLKTEFLLTSNSSIYFLIVAVSIFLLLYDIKEKPEKEHNITKGIAKLSLSTFLISYIFDQIFIELLISKGIYLFKDRIIHLLYLTPITIFLSLMIAFLISQLIKILIWLYNIILNKIKNKKVEKFAKNY